MPRASNRRNNAFRATPVPAGKANKRQRRKLLASLGITNEYFVEGSISINKRICEGVSCKLCAKVCPTNALYWRMGEIGITKELCIYCGACILACIVNDCIEIARKRAIGEVETFSKPKDFTALQNKINTRKRFERVDEARELLPKPEDYPKRRKTALDMK